MKKIIPVIIGIAVIACILFVKLPLGPSGDTRVILEHTYETYIAPACFEQAETSNNISETTWSKLGRYDYKPESACTEDAFKKVKQPLWFIISDWIF